MTPRFPLTLVRGHDNLPCDPMAGVRRYEQAHSQLCLGLSVSAGLLRAGGITRLPKGMELRDGVIFLPARRGLGVCP